MASAWSRRDRSWGETASGVGGARTPDERAGAAAAVEEEFRRPVSVVVEIERRSGLVLASASSSIRPRGAIRRPLEEDRKSHIGKIGNGDHRPEPLDTRPRCRDESRVSREAQEPRVRYRVSRGSGLTRARKPGEATIVWYDNREWRPISDIGYRCRPRANRHPADGTIFHFYDDFVHDHSRHLTDVTKLLLIWCCPANVCASFRFMRTRMLFIHICHGRGDDRSRLAPDNDCARGASRYL